MILQTALLDPRSEAVARQDPVPASVNIPVDEIAMRTHELPDKGRMIQVVGSNPSGDEAVRLLRSLDRPAEVRAGPLPHVESAARYRLWEPNPFLEEMADSLPKGVAIDLGCGTGRSAVYLASLGYDVVAVDLLQDALDRGRDLARRYLGPADGSVEWVRMDLDRQIPSGSFDVVAMFFYNSTLLQSRLSSLLRPGGMAVIETFSTQNRDLTGRPRDPARIVDPDAIEGLRIVNRSEQQVGDRHTVRAAGNT
jgi:SAM-dependent methyltransferase